MSDWRLDAIGQHDDSPPPPPADEAGRGGADEGPSAGRRRLRRGAASAVVVVALAGFGGALWYAYDTYRTQGGAGIAPLIRADLEPTRIKPDQPGGMDVPHRDRLVLQDPAGDPEADGEATVVASAEEPLPPPDETAVSLVETANAAPVAPAIAADGGAGADPIAAIIAGDGKPDAASRAGATPKADAAAEAVTASGAGAPSLESAPATLPEPAPEASGADAPSVPAVPAGPVQVAQLDQPRTASDATPAPLTPPAGDDMARGAASAVPNPPSAPAPDGTEALLPRLMQVAQATDGTSPEEDADPAAAEDEATDAAADTDGTDDAASEGLPEISPTPQLAPATPQAEAAAGISSPDAEATPVMFAVPLGALNAAAAADLRVAEAIAPAGFDAAAALTAFGTRASGLEQSEPAAPAGNAIPDQASAAPAGADGTADGAATQTAAAPAAPPATQDPAPQVDGGWRVQLAAVTSQEEAEEEWSRFQARFPTLLGSLDLIVPTAMIDGRRWYRVQAGPLDESGARRLCVQLKEQGADCIVRQ